MYKKCDGNPCTWFLNGEGVCFLNGSYCMNPFSEEGCKIQDDEIFHEPTSLRFKESDKPLGVITKGEIFSKLNVKGRVVADYFIPYAEIEEMNVNPYVAIKYAIKTVREKYNKCNLLLQALDAKCYIFHNMELVDGVIGIYIIMT